MRTLCDLLAMHAYSTPSGKSVFVPVEVQQTGFYADVYDLIQGTQLTRHEFIKFDDALRDNFPIIVENDLPHLHTESPLKQAMRKIQLDYLAKDIGKSPDQEELKQYHKEIYELIKSSTIKFPLDVQRPM